MGSLNMNGKCEELHKFDSTTQCTMQVSVKLLLKVNLTWTFKSNEKTICNNIYSVPFMSSFTKLWSWSKKESQNLEGTCKKFNLIPTKTENMSFCKLNRALSHELSDKVLVNSENKAAVIISGQ